MFQLPDGYFEYEKNSDSATYIRPGHTVSEPSLLIINRKTPVANGNGFSIPVYRLRLIDGHLDGDGKPVKERSSVEILIKQPVNASLTRIQAALDFASSMLADEDFQDDALVDYMYPKEGNEPS